MKALERLILPYQTAASHTFPTQHSSRPLYSIVSALPSLSLTIAAGFNQWRLSSRAIAITIDISNASDVVNHSSLRDMIQQSELQHILVRWISTYLKCRSSIAFNSVNSRPRAVHMGVSRGSAKPPTLFNFAFDYLLPTAGLITSYAGDFTIMDSSSSIPALERSLNLQMHQTQSELAYKDYGYPPTKPHTIPFTPVNSHSKLSQTLPLFRCTKPQRPVASLLTFTSPLHLTVTSSQAE